VVQEPGEDLSGPVEHSSTAVAQIGPELELRFVRCIDLQEQDINAQVMHPKEFEQLVSNIKDRGALESLPYCAQPGGEGKVEIVSGHHRMRAARQAGMDTIPVLVDTSALTRSEVVSKQIAHNALVGQSDEKILRQMISEIDNPDDLLRTGLDADMMPLPQMKDDTDLATPQAAFEWRTVAFTFLPHQLDNFKELLDQIDGRQDLIGAAPLELFPEFAREVAKFSRVKEVRAVGTAIYMLTKLAAKEIDLDLGADQPEDWVSLREVVGTAKIPQDVAAIIEQTINRLLATGDITEKGKFRALEYACANLLADPSFTAMEGTAQGMARLERVPDNVDPDTGEVLPEPAPVEDDAEVSADD